MATFQFDNEFTLIICSFHALCFLIVCVMITVVSMDHFRYKMKKLTMYGTTCGHYLCQQRTDRQSISGSSSVLASPGGKSVEVSRPSGEKTTFSIPLREWKREDVSAWLTYNGLSRLVEDHIVCGADGCTLVELVHWIKTNSKTIHTLLCGMGFSLSESLKLCAILRVVSRQKPPKARKRTTKSKAECTDRDDSSSSDDVKEKKPFIVDLPSISDKTIDLPSNSDRDAKKETDLIGASGKDLDSDNDLKSKQKGKLKLKKQKNFKEGKKGKSVNLTKTKNKEKICARASSPAEKSRAEVIDRTGNDNQIQGIIAPRFQVDASNDPTPDSERKAAVSDISGSISSVFPASLPDK